ncbi:MAG: aspartyl/glutamyl-tRNA amidotransferase subunit C [Candidatus Parcubacteria bacterium]|nr:aspartyl/glutamyl-tRNA amidotransferase subunit C [Candidatus Parcubacteria bacterium]
MTTKEEVQKLAALARIHLHGSELEKFAGEFDAILAYIGQLEKLELPKERHAKPALRNVMRTDGEPHATGEFTGKLVAQFPASENNALSVKQIITHD